MASAALAQLTQLLDSKKLAGTLTRPLEQGRACTKSGVTVLDEHLAGGWPQGQLSEIVGPASSGRTSVMLSTFAHVTQQGGVVALVDVADRLDPASAEAAGVVLDRVLWVRGPHLSSFQADGHRPRTSRPMTVVDLAVQRGLRAFDLIVRAGGFAVVACDLADVPVRYIRALPTATWFRLGHVLEGQDAVGLLLASQPLGRSAGGVSLALQARSEWAGRSAQSRRLAGLSVTPAVSQRVRKGSACSFALSATR
jgi:hypothetical protein